MVRPMDGGVILLVSSTTIGSISRIGMLEDSYVYTVSIEGADNVEHKPKCPFAVRAVLYRSESIEKSF